MGHRLAAHLESAGFAVTRELSFDGPEDAEVLDAWRHRLDGLRQLRRHCGEEVAPLVRDELLACLGSEQHRCRATARCCIATRS
jgi:hypothetical protein